MILSGTSFAFSIRRYLNPASGSGSAGKGNELKAIRALLDVLVLDRCIVTLDALGCQTDVAAAIVAWNRAIIAQTADLVCAYKPNIAFFEALGAAGMAALRQTRP